MAKNTEISLRNKVIYSIYVRNHTNDGTFNAVAEDLDRIKSLGTDIIWFMPIHPIGVKNKKGSPVLKFHVDGFKFFVAVKRVNHAYNTN